jgi:putative salt-induced outer membrane protein YdiY
LGCGIDLEKVRKMKTYLKILIPVWICTFWAIHPVLADEIHLVNGDRITGKFIKMEDNQLIFETDYAGQVTINWQKVAQLITDTPVKAILRDGKILETTDLNDNTLVAYPEKKEKNEFSLTQIKAINSEQKPSFKITARVNAGMEIERGNTDSDDLHIDGEFIARAEKYRVTVGGELDKEKSSGDTTDENWLAYGKYDYFLTAKWFLYFNTLLEHDKFADLDLRSTVGVGPGYQFFESPELNLFVSAGPAYVSEDFIEAGHDNFYAAQWLIGYDQYFFKKFVQLFHRQNGYISLEDSENWLIETRQGLRFPIYKGFTATVQYSYDYENDPAPDAEEKWDSELMLLMGYQLEN